MVSLADYSTLYKSLELDAIPKPVKHSLSTDLFAKIASLAIHQTQRLVAAKRSNLAIRTRFHASLDVNQTRRKKVCGTTSQTHEHT